MLDTAAYKPFVQAFRSHVKMRPINTTGIVNFELCYKVKRPPSRFPALVFHFEGADWEMPLKNYMVFDEESGLFCLMVIESPGMSTFGNVQTQNMHVLYNLEKDQLSFAPAKCDKL
ncbi:aspartic proteinase nepenthesin-1-like [Asparagus officinalis]|uniref:aspartic proteinase nepenthesin-1-like n=1 Tax=Asparagus officinalis TaxID=4686 RepID=UPI00098E4120|nr:aspartic proteinase nepenthesin-1-like [Asparagus officinalis]